jgi:hypothetical protein
MVPMTVNIVISPRTRSPFGPDDGGYRFAIDYFGKGLAMVRLAQNGDL